MCFTIFLLWISFKNMRKSVFCNVFPSMHLFKSIIFYLRAVDKLPPCPPPKSLNLIFRVKITVLYRPFFQKQNVISQVLALTRNKKWPFFHKKHQINKFGFLNFWGGLTFFYPYYIFLTMDGLSKCLPPHPPPENSDLLVYFTHWRLYWTSIFQNMT